MTTTLHIKTDKQTRDQVEKMAKSHGITVTALVNLSLRHVLENGITLSPRKPVNLDAWKNFVGSLKGKLAEDPARWQHKIRKAWERKLP